MSQKTVEWLLTNSDENDRAKTRRPAPGSEFACGDLNLAKHWVAIADNLYRSPQFRAWQC
ncbi:MAG: hypothetical protein ACFB4J_06015 [Elainellaceae cyanobacterium]